MGVAFATHCVPFVCGRAKSRTDGYVFGAVLGRGSFGTVYAATERDSATEVAVKAVCTAGFSRQERLKAQAEVELWRTIGIHPNVVRLHRSFSEGHRLFIVMELCQCTVMDLLRKDYSHVRSCAPWHLREMLLGVQACHQAMVVHRDVKPDNFLVGGGGARIQLCDFGLAARLPRGSGSGNGGLRDRTGTALFMSPEMLHGKEYGLGTDVWSFAVLAYCVVFAQFPYILEEMTPEAAKRAVMKGGPPARLQGVTRLRDATGASFLTSLMQREPDRRASAGEALEHPFLQVGSQTEKSRREMQAKTADTLAPLAKTTDTLEPLEDDSMREDEDTWGESATTSTASTGHSD